MEGNVVNNQWHVELDDCRVETLKSVSGVSFTQEYTQLLQNSPDGKPVPDVLGTPDFSGTLTLTRSMDKSDKFTQWIMDFRDPTKTEGSAQTFTLAYVNAQNNEVKRLQFEDVRVSNWSGPGLAAGDSGEVEETLELTFVSCDPV
ncbi:phage tail protein [Streptomyces sp. NPDC048491]|uniref:phage tail protein n=1 Tax=Streptomyces sp. NPDC048491 TaxID=3157207 RepID=UPI003430D80E